MNSPAVKYRCRLLVAVYRFLVFTGWPTAGRITVPVCVCRRLFLDSGLHVSILHSLFAVHRNQVRRFGSLRLVRYYIFRFSPLLCIIYSAFCSLRVISRPAGFPCRLLSTTYSTPRAPYPGPRFGFTLHSFRIRAVPFIVPGPGGYLRMDIRHPGIARPVRIVDRRRHIAGQWGPHPVLLPLGGGH